MNPRTVIEIEEDFDECIDEMPRVALENCSRMEAVTRRDRIVP